MTSVIRLSMAGPAQARREPGIGRNRGTGRPQSFPDPKTKTGIADWRQLWRGEGEPHLAGWVDIEVTIGVERPAGHYNTRGMFNVKAEREPFPKRPDVDNVVKLILDALKKHAFDDDAWVRGITAWKLWVPAGRVSTDVTISLCTLS